MWLQSLPLRAQDFQASPIRAACYPGRDYRTGSEQAFHTTSIKSHVMTLSPHSSTPNIPLSCAFQFARGRNERVDVIMTFPFVSPEYSLSLSAE